MYNQPQNLIIMSASQRIEDIQAQLLTSEQQYKRLLEKNQNDLIWIKQRQAQVKKSLAEMETERSGWKEIQNRLSLDNEFLRKELARVREANGEEGVMIKSLSSRVEQQELVIRGLEESKEGVVKELGEVKGEVRRLVQEREEGLVERRGVEERIERITDEAESLRVQNSRLKEQISALQEVKLVLVNSGCQTDPISEPEPQNPSILQTLQLQHLDTLNQLNTKTHQLSLLQPRLQDSLQKLKSLNDKNKSIMIENQSLRKHCLEADQSLQRSKLKLEEERKKTKDMVNRSLDTSEANIRAGELEQENKILKEMIKSVRTMVRVREVEIEKYKTKLSHEERERDRERNANEEKSRPRRETEEYSQRFHKLSQKKSDTESSTPHQKRYEKKLPRLK